MLELGMKIFIPFPKPSQGIERCQRWINACCRENFTVDNINRNTYICALHFVDFLRVFVNNNATIIDLFHLGVMVTHFKSRGMLVQILLFIFLFSPLTDRYMETKKCCVHVINNTRFEKGKHHPRTKKVYQTKQFKLIIMNGPCCTAS